MKTYLKLLKAIGANMPPEEAIFEDLLKMYEEVTKDDAGVRHLIEITATCG